MSASLSPWLLVWMALLTGAVKIRQHMSSRYRALFAAAAAGATVLMIVSRSGQTAVTMVAVLGLAALWMLRARATPRSTGIVVAALAIVLPVVLWLAAKSVGDRLGGERLGNSSWEERASSIVAGYSLFAGGDWRTLLFGFGPGQTAFAVTQEKGLEAVWSVSLCYLYDTGLLGAVALLWLGSMMVRNWKRARFSPVFAAIFVVWVVGVTLTTSYEQLLPLWLALGWFTVWPDVMEAVASSPVVRSVSELPPVISGPPEPSAVPPSSWAAACPTLAADARARGRWIIDGS
jgi:hypothetical protein